MSETHRLRLVQNHTGLTRHWFCMYIIYYSALNWPSDFVFSCRSCIGTFCKPIIQTYGISPLRVTHDYRSRFLYIQFLFQTTIHHENCTYCHRKCFVTELCNGHYCNWGLPWRMITCSYLTCKVEVLAAVLLKIQVFLWCDAVLLLSK